VPAAAGEHELRADTNGLQDEHPLVALGARQALEELDEVRRCLAVRVGHDGSSSVSPVSSTRNRVGSTACPSKWSVTVAFREFSLRPCDRQAACA